MGKKIRFLFFALCIGGAIGAFIWAFLRVMDIGQKFLFTGLPKLVQTPGLVLVVCILGGVVIGIYEKLFHASPEKMESTPATGWRSAPSRLCCRWSLAQALVRKPG